MAKRVRIQTDTLFSFVLSGLLLVSTAHGSEYHQPVPRVLLLNSYHQSFQWSGDITEAVQATFEDAGRDVRLHVEYMDLKRHALESSLNSLRQLYGQRYADLSFEAIIVSDDFALDFALEHRESLFHNAPIIFCGINNFSAQRIAGHANITGVAENIDIHGTIALAKSLHPNIRHVAVINDGAPPAVSMMERTRVAMESYQGTLDLIELFDLSADDLRKRLQGLPARTVVLHIHYYTDKATNAALTVRQSFAISRNSTTLPIYTCWDHQIGYGATGGLVTNGRAQGKTAAQMAIRIFEGESADAIPPISVSPNTPMFDFRYLAPYGLSVADLPAESVILHQPASVYYQYRTTIWSVGVLLLLLVVANIALLINVLKRKRAESALLLSEQRLHQAEKMKAIGQLAGGIAHDFNNQLSGVYGYADLLMANLEGEKLRSYARCILEAAEQAAELTNQLLAFSRKGKYMSVPVNIHNTIEQVLSMLEHSIDKRIRIGRDLQATPATTMGDPSQLQNAFLNIALNARDAMPKGGELTFATHAQELTQEQCSALPHTTPPGSYLCVSITDTGCGMDEDTQQHMFEPFFTTKDVGKGTGMGLASVYGTIRNHKGAIAVTSAIGKGTTFRIYLPSIEDVYVEDAPEARDAPVAGTARILVVDDEDIARRIATDMLGELGYNVRTCSDGREAVALYETDWQEIDLVILDMVMPELDGRDTFDAMLAINPNVRAILSSGYSIDGEAKSILDQGVKAFIGKPFSQADLSKTVAQVLQG